LSVVSHCDTNGDMGTRDDEPGGARTTGSGPDPDSEANPNSHPRDDFGAHERDRPHRGHRHRRRTRPKSRILHTRVSEDLSEEIRRFADDLRVPASNLVRNVLEEVFSVVDAVSDDIGELFEDVVGEAEDARDRISRRVNQRRSRQQQRASRSRGRTHRRRQSDADLETEFRRDEAEEAGGARDEPGFPEVIGWQPLVLNRSGACARCDCPLGRGERAFAGLTEKGPSSITLCQTCTRDL